MSGSVCFTTGSKWPTLKMCRWASIARRNGRKGKREQTINLKLTHNCLVNFMNNNMTVNTHFLHFIPVPV